MELAGTVWNFGKNGGPQYGPIKFNADGSTSGARGMFEHFWKTDDQGAITLSGNGQFTVFPFVPSKTRQGHRNGTVTNSHWIRQVTTGSISIPSLPGLGDTVFLHNFLTAVKHLPVFIRASKRHHLVMNEMGFYPYNGIDEDGVVLSWWPLCRMDRRCGINPWLNIIPMLEAVDIPVAHIAPNTLPAQVQRLDPVYDFAIGNRHGPSTGGRSLPSDLWQTCVIDILKERGYSFMDLDSIGDLGEAVKVMKSSRFAITIDTFWQHFAAACRIPQITFWGHGNAPADRYSYWDSGLQTLIYFDEAKKAREAIRKLGGR